MGLGRISTKTRPDALMLVTLKGDFDGFSVMNIHSMVLAQNFEVLDIRDKDAGTILFSTRFRGKEAFGDLIDQLNKVQGVNHVAPKPTTVAQV